MHIDLAGRVAIVTGAGRGIGRSIARRLAAEGVLVTAADASADLLDEVGAEWRDAGWDGLQTRCDVRSAQNCRSVANDTVSAFERIDVLVNNAGVAGGASVEDLDEATWDLNLETNLKGTFLMSQAVLPVMKAQRQGRIINASSFAAVVPSLGGAAYAASKNGVEALTRVLAGELGPYNITVNGYAPGMVPSAMNGFDDLDDERKEQLLDTLTLRRWGNPEDIANLICFLASDLAGYITGTTINISGGKLATQAPWAAYRKNR